MAEAIIGWAFRMLLLWIGIVVVGAFVAVFVKNIAWRVATLLFAVASVPAYIAFEISPVGRAFHEVREARIYKNERRAFAEYCVGRKNSIGKIASPVDDAIEIAFAGASSFNLLASFNAGELAEMFTAKPPFAGQLCSTTALKYIEGRSVHRGTKQFRFHLCPTKTSTEGSANVGYSKADEIGQPAARYRLQFSPPFLPAPNPEFPYRKFTRIQVQLVESETQKVLGEDTLFFLGPTADGNGVCPNAYAQVHELLLKAFAIQSANLSISTDATR